jgi:prevent-host-death family protein
MSEIGIRALKQNASKVVARAKAGESITITEHGRPVARLVPIGRSRIDEMVEAGVATAPEGHFRDLPQPALRTKGQPSASETLEQMRHDESS